MLFGIFILVFSVTGYIFSWRYWMKNNYKMAILLLIISGLSLRIFVSTDFFLHSWDERYHALVSKNLIQHPLKPTLYDNPVLPYNYQNWAANHIWLHKQPLPLWILASSMWIFGVNELALRLPSVLMTTFGIWLIFYIGNYIFTKKVGYLAAFFYSINGLIIELTGGRVATDHIDIFFLFFIQLAVCFIIGFAKKGKIIFNLLTGICIGAAILSKWLPSLILLPIWLLIVIESGIFRPKIIFIHFIILLITITIVFLPWQIYIYTVFPLEANWEAGYNYRHITEVLSDQTGPFYYFINKIRINYGELIYIPLLWFLWETVKNFGNKKRVAITIWFLIPFIFFSFVKTKMQAYILFTSPALFIMTAEFWVMLNEYKKSHKFKWLSNLILLLLIALPIRYMIERIKPFEPIDRNPQWVLDLKKLNDQRFEKGVLFNYNKPIEAMFYTNLIAYPEIPKIETINYLHQKGYLIFINDEGKIPEEIRKIQSCTFLNLTSSND